MSENSGRTRHPKPRDAKTSGSAGHSHSTKKPKHPGGRPSDYRPEYADLAYKFTLLGATDKKLAEFFHVSEQTINAWKKSFPEFLESLKRGKEVANATVAESLFKRANGYSHPAVKIFNTELGVIEHQYTEHYPPETAAAIFFLKNRCPDLWRDKQIVEHGGEGGGPIRLEETSAADLRKLAEKRGLVPALTPLKPAGT